jgi:hypothetical protein
VAPPYLPESEDSFETEYHPVDTAYAADVGEEVGALPTFELDAVEEDLGLAPLGDFTALDAGESAIFDFAPEPVDEGIPADAFIYPVEQGAGAEVPDAGVTEHFLSPAGDPVTALADRLERLARQLRAEGVSALAAGAVSGDRLDALMAGLLTGYLAAQSDRD